MAGLELGIVEFDCGCVGMISGTNVIRFVDCCKMDEDNEIHVCRPSQSADLLSKDRRSVDSQTQLSLMMELGRLVQDGYALRTVRQLLK